MQSFIEALRSLVGQSGLFILIMGLSIGLLYVWGLISSMEWFIRWRIRLSPKNPDLHISLGDWLADVDEFEEAEKEYRLAIELNPKARQGYYQLYLMQKKNNQEKNAEETITRLAELFPDDHVVYAWKGNFWSNQDSEKAEEYFRKSLEMAPLSSFAFLQYGIFLNEHKRFEDAERILRNARRLQPVHPNVYTHLAYALEQLGRYQEAEKEYRKYIKLDPKSTVSHQLFSRFLFLQNRIGDAEKAIRTAIKIDSENAVSWSMLGAILIKEGERFSEAEMALQKAISFNPSDTAAFYNLGSLQEHLNLHEEAEATYRKAIEIDPAEVNTYHKLSKLLKSRGRTEDAISNLQKALEIDPKDFIALIEIASIQRTIGKAEEAKESAEKARSIIPKDENYWYNLACIEGILGNTELAFENLRKATQEKGIDKEWAWEDPDLQWIRDDPRFAEIVGPKPEK